MSTEIKITLVSLGALTTVGSHLYKFRDEVRVNKQLEKKKRCSVEQKQSFRILNQQNALIEIQYNGS